MHLRPLCLALLCSTLALKASLSENGFPRIAQWAGSDAASLGFSEEALAGYLAARKKDLRTGAHPPWSDWLKKVEVSANPSLRAWALARRVEAGDYSSYQAFQVGISDHLLGISTPGSGRLDKVISSPPYVHGWAMPDPLQLDHASVFWSSLRKTLQERFDRSVDENLYSIWCWGTHPDQRDLVLEIAAKVQARPSLANRAPDPWNDPRFWLVMDWLLAWGTQEDVAAIRTCLPSVHAKRALERLLTALEDVPNFFAVQPKTHADWDRALRPPPVAREPGAQPADASLVPPQQRAHSRALGYPRQAHARGLMTHLSIEIVVDAQGRAQSARPRPGPWLGFFAPEGCTYAMGWSFRPGTVNGVPTAFPFTVTIPFHLHR